MFIHEKGADMSKITVDVSLSGSEKGESFLPGPVADGYIMGTCTVGDKEGALLQDDENCIWMCNGDEKIRLDNREIAKAINDSICCGWSE